MEYEPLDCVVHFPAVIEYNKGINLEKPNVRILALGGLHGTQARIRQSLYIAHGFVRNDNCNLAMIRFTELLSQQNLTW